jgi:very-short-patch-repair endonuclease
MAPRTPKKRDSAAWALARRQHGVISRTQLLELRFTPSAIKHRIASGRLYRLWRGVYAVGRPSISTRGRWIAAVLTCGRGAVLSHASAAALWDIRQEKSRRVDVSVPLGNDRRHKGIAVHQSACLPRNHRTRKHGIPVTTPFRTLVDLATRLDPGALEAAVNQADKLDLIDPEALRAALDDAAGVRGASRLRSLLDRRSFTLTDSELERLFLPIARQAGLPLPRTQQIVNGFKVDFYWPELGLIVETEGLRYHRTPAQQATDRLRDQAHTAAGLIPLRFTHAQVRFDPERVRSTLKAVTRRRSGHRR